MPLSVLRLFNSSSFIGVKFTLLFFSVLLSAGASPRLAADAGTRIEIGQTRDNLEDGYQDWHSDYLRFEHNRANGVRYLLSFQHAGRFGFEDTQVDAGLLADLSQRNWVRIDLTESETSRVKPKHSFRLEAGRRFPGAINGSISWHREHFEPAVVDLYALGVDKYVGHYRIAYTLVGAHLIGHISGPHVEFSQTLAADYYFRERDSIGVMASRGRQIEYQGTGQPVISKASSWSLRGYHGLSRSWSLRWGLVRARLNRYYTRSGILLGGEYRY